MRLPHAGAHYSHRVSAGLYVARRLRKAKLTTLANDVTAATTTVRTHGRALEDTADAIQEALADRDMADEELDTAAQGARLGLASRGVDADKKAPYTLIFHAGIGYYIAARLEDEDSRYGELKSRLIENLPENDSVRTTTVTAIDNGVAAFDSATTTLKAARTEESLAKTRLEASEESWERLMEKVYGLLVADLGRPAAERFFPKFRAKKSNNSSGTE